MGGGYTMDPNLAKELEQMEETEELDPKEAVLEDITPDVEDNIADIMMGRCPPGTKPGG